MSIVNKLKRATVSGLVLLFFNCSPKFERVDDVQNLLIYPSQYLKRNVEIQGKILDPNDGVLYLDEPMVSKGIYTNCVLNEEDSRVDRKRADLICRILEKIGNYYDIERVVVKGRVERTNNTYYLKVYGGFIEAKGKKYNF